MKNTVEDFGDEFPVDNNEGVMKAPMRDLFSTRFVIVVSGLVFVVLSFVGCFLMVRGDDVPESLERWWIANSSFLMGTLTTTSTPPRRSV